MRRRGRGRRGRKRRWAEARDGDGPLGICEVLDGVGRVSGVDGLEPRDGASFAFDGFVGRGALVGVGSDGFARVVSCLCPVMAKTAQKNA